MLNLVVRELTTRLYWVKTVKGNNCGCSEIHTKHTNAMCVHNQNSCMLRLVKTIREEERERFSKRVEKREAQGSGKRRIFVGGEKSITILEGSLASPARPSGRKSMEIKI
jgi:hypothetical protein